MAFRAPHQRDHQEGADHPAGGLELYGLGGALVIALAALSELSEVRPDGPAQTT